MKRKKNTVTAQLVKCPKIHCFAILGTHEKGRKFSCKQFPVTKQNFSPNVDMQFAAFVVSKTFFTRQYLPKRGPLFTDIDQWEVFRRLD